ncbi:MAG: translation initiation factor Sui1 [Desulfobacterales bacterium]|nr:translation initiation factor Sui1 [Deltaproteobacteria bacterium]NNK96306.1 translation initiation factor Sui1 [Desulfobacterales bacterium]
MKKPKSNGLVYSTDGGRSCPGCGHPLKQCRCSRQKIPQQGDGVVRIGRQTKGRKGSGVSLITGLPLGEPDLKKLAKQLKKKCGSGGTVKDGVIEIQGDHREALVEALQKMGYTVKLAGG